MSGRTLQNVPPLAPRVTRALLSDVRMTTDPHRPARIAINAVADWLEEASHTPGRGGFWATLISQSMMAAVSKILRSEASRVAVLGREG